MAGNIGRVVMGVKDKESKHITQIEILSKDDLLNLCQVIKLLA